MSFCPKLVKYQYLHLDNQGFFSILLDFQCLPVYSATFDCGSLRKTATVHNIHVDRYGFLVMVRNPK